jgi:hypothetical protein
LRYVLDYLDVIVELFSTLDGVWRDEDVLSIHRTASGGDLHDELRQQTGMARARGPAECWGATYQHLGADGPIDIVHEDVKLIQAPQRRAHCFPHGEEQTNVGKGLLATREGLCVPHRRSLLRLVRLNLNVQRFSFVVEEQLAPEATLAQEVDEIGA